MASNSVGRYLTAPWGAFVEWLGAPADAEATRLGITNKDERNAFGHAYTAALIAHGYLGMPISGGRTADASELVDFLGRAKENLPGIFGQQDDFRDYYRDLWNNGIGADIGNYAKTHLYSREELGKLVKDAMDDGTIVSSLTDSRIPAQPAGGYLSWPIPSPPQYQGPNATPYRRGVVGDRFGNWGFSSTSLASSIPSDDPASFSNRFGNWDSVPSSPTVQRAPVPTPAFRPDAVYSPAGDFFGNFPRTSDDNGSSPPADDQPIRRLGRRSCGQSQSSAFDMGAPALLPASADGIASGFSNVSSPMAQPQNSEGSLSLNDAYLLYRKRLDANASQASAMDAGAPAAPLASPDDSNFSGGLLGRLTALIGIDPQNPDQLAPPPQDDDLRAFYRDNAAQPWTLQRLR